MTHTATITRLFPSGGYECSTVVDGRLLVQRYFGYSKREVKSLFRDYVARVMGLVDHLCQERN